MRIKSLVVAAAISAATFTGAAWATPIPALAQGDSATFSITDNGFGGYNLVATGTITVSLLTSTEVDLIVTLNNDSKNANNTTISDPNNVRLAVWGFAITPDVTGVTFVTIADNGMIGADLGNIPSQKSIEVCAFGHSCSSGANLGVLAGTSDTFGLNMTRDANAGTTISLDLLGVKWQTDKGSFEFSCSDCGVTEGSSSTSSTSSTGGTGTSGQVPEPSSSALALLGLAMLGATFLKRRSSQRA